MQVELRIVQLGDAADDAQPQSDPAIAAVHPHKGFAELFAFRLVHAGAFIFHRQHRRRRLLKFEGNHALLRAVAVRILHQVPEQHPKLNGVSAYRHVFLILGQRQRLLVSAQHRL